MLLTGLMTVIIVIIYWPYCVFEHLLVIDIDDEKHWYIIISDQYSAIIPSVIIGNRIPILGNYLLLLMTTVFFYWRVTDYWRYLFIDPDIVIQWPVFTYSRDWWLMTWWSILYCCIHYSDYFLMKWYSVPDCSSAAVVDWYSETFGILLKYSYWPCYWKLTGVRTWLLLVAIVPIQRWHWPMPSCGCGIDWRSDVTGRGNHVDATVATLWRLFWWQWMTTAGGIELLLYWDTSWYWWLMTWLLLLCRRGVVLFNYGQAIIWLILTACYWYC